VARRHTIGMQTVDCHTNTRTKSTPDVGQLITECQRYGGAANNKTYADGRELNYCYGDSIWDLDQSRTSHNVNEIVGPSWITPALVLCCLSRNWSFPSFGLA